MNNLFADIPSDLPEELMQQLAGEGSVRIERIVSRGQCSEAGFWYDQDESEYVCVLKGEAILEIEREGSVVEVRMRAGDQVLLPAHQRHRVQWTCEERDTVWLAVFFR